MFFTLKKQILLIVWNSLILNIVLITMWLLILQTIWMNHTSTTISLKILIMKLLKKICLLFKIFKTLLNIMLPLNTLMMIQFLNNLKMKLLLLPKINHWLELFHWNMLLNTLAKKLSLIFAINLFMKFCAVKFSLIGIGSFGQLSQPKLLVWTSTIFITVLLDLKFSRTLKSNWMNFLKDKLLFQFELAIQF